MHVTDTLLMTVGKKFREKWTYFHRKETRLKIENNFEKRSDITSTKAFFLLVIKSAKKKLGALLQKKEKKKNKEREKTKKDMQAVQNRYQLMDAFLRNLERRLQKMI